LIYVSKNPGFAGELKGCEKQFGLDRGDLDGAERYFAVLLLAEFQKTMWN